MREWLDVLGNTSPEAREIFRGPGMQNPHPREIWRGQGRFISQYIPTRGTYNRWSVLSLGMTFVNSSRWQWNSAEFQFDRLQMNLNLKHKEEYESLQCKGRLYSTKLWHKVFHYLVRILSPLTMHLFLLVHLISNQCKGQSPKERNMGHSMAYNVCSL